MVYVIIVDSNIFIFCESDGAPEHTAALGKLGKALQEGKVGINVIIASEVFHKLRGFFGGTEAAARVSRIIDEPRSEYLEFSPSSITRAVRLARDFGIGINDALIAQQAIERGASVLTDNLKDFGKIKTIKIIPLRASA